VRRFVWLLLVLLGGCGVLSSFDGFAGGSVAAGGGSEPLGNGAAYDLPTAPGSYGATWDMNAGTYCANTAAFK
jgi:hypothetical protein